VRPIDWNTVPIEGALALLTVEDISPGVDMMMADFRDDRALYYYKLDGWLGLSHAGVMMGKGIPELINGIWYVEIDEEKSSSNQNHIPDISLMSLRKIG
jgi:hypothetical protein